MRLAGQNIFAGFIGMTLFYGVLVILASWAEGSDWFFWFLLAGYFPFSITCGVAEGRSNYRRAPGDCFRCAVAAVLFFAFLNIAPQWRAQGMPDAFGYLLWSSGVGVPLGISAMCAMKAESVPLSWREILVSAVLGCAGVFLSLFFFAGAAIPGLRLFVPARDVIWTHFYWSPRQRLPLWWVSTFGPHPASASLLIDGTMSILTAYWDTMLLACGALALTALGRRIWRG